MQLSVAEAGDDKEKTIVNVATMGKAMTMVLAGWFCLVFISSESVEVIDKKHKAIRNDYITVGFNINEYLYINGNNLFCRIWIRAWQSMVVGKIHTVIIQR